MWDCVIEGEAPDSTAELGCLADFELLASRPLDATIPGARAVKTVLDRADEDRLHFTHSERFAIHHDFVSARLSGDGLPPVPDLTGFNRDAYTSPDRRFVLGTITHYEEPDLWTAEFAPYDSAPSELVDLSWQALTASTYVGQELLFHPTSAGHAATAAELGLPVITTDELFAGISWQPLNLGEALGQLRFFTAEELQTRYVGPRDVAVLDTVPNDISVVAGLITSEPQTPLSHVNVLSQNRGTPNMSLRGAHTDPVLRALEDRWVRLRVDSFEYVLEEVSREDADLWWDANRPPPLEIPPLDLSVQQLVDVGDLGVDDVSAVGGKAANYGVLSRIEGLFVPEAFAVPVSFYAQFAQQNGFDVRVQELLADPVFLDDPGAREAALLALQADMLVAPVDPAFETLLMDKLAADFPGLRMRFRSSTNAEDLESFSGAGLYSSASGEPGDPSRPVLDAVRHTWASLWNFRAFEERSYNGIPQDAVAMALLVNPAFRDEEANGVALTANLFDPAEPAHYVNVQKGEASVVAPEPGITVDSFLYFYSHPGQPTTYLSHSSFTLGNDTVLSSPQIHELGESLIAIHEGFAPFFGREGGFYAMDVEFKLDDFDGTPRIWVKQARPHPGWAEGLEAR